MGPQQLSLFGAGRGNWFLPPGPCPATSWGSLYLGELQLFLCVPPGRICTKWGKEYTMKASVLCLGPRICPER
jgi:hypothetical protein